MKETWRKIPEYEESYMVSNLGRVKSIDRKTKGRHGLVTKKGKILKQCISTNGYYCINLSKNDKKKMFTIHQLVAICFLNHIPNGTKLVVDHIDNNKLNNNLSNLRIITHRENLSKDKKNVSSKYVGVSFDKNKNKWTSFIRINGHKKYLGAFECELKASEAYQTELKKILNGSNEKNV